MSKLHPVVSKIIPNHKFLMRMRMKMIRSLTTTTKVKSSSHYPKKIRWSSNHPEMIKNAPVVDIKISQR